MDGKETPKHLEGLKKILDQQYLRRPDNEEYAEIAFTLFNAEGKQEEMKEVADYIQQTHRKIKDQHEAHSKMIGDIKQWMYWAENWTVHKDDVKA